VRIGKVSETLEVTAPPRCCRQKSAQVNNVISGRTTDNLPLETRNYVELTLLFSCSVSVDPHSMNLGSTPPRREGRPYINGNASRRTTSCWTALTTTRRRIIFWVSRPPRCLSANSTHYPDTLPRSEQLQRAEVVQCRNQSLVPTGITGCVPNSSATTFFQRQSMGKWFDGGNPDRSSSTPKLRWNMFGEPWGGSHHKEQMFFFADYQGGLP